MKNTNLIGISGKIGAGKDTVGSIIQWLTNPRIYTDPNLKIDEDSIASYVSFEDWENGENLSAVHTNSYQIKKYADKLKDMVCLLIGCSREDLEDQDFKNKELGNDWIKYVLTYTDKYQDTPYKYTFLSKKESKEHLEEQNCVFTSRIEKIKLTPRLLLQLLGTEFGRNIIHPNIWVNSLFSDYKSKISDNEGFSKLKHKDITVILKETPLYSYSNFPKWIITDMRFPNELEAVKQRGGITIRINRNSGSMINDFMNNFYTDNQHPSETALDDAEFDYTIINDGTVEDLIEKVREILIKEKIL